MLYRQTIQTLWGPMTLTCDEHALVSAECSQGHMKDDAHPLLTKVVQWLRAYEKGSPSSLKIPLTPTGTAWQQRVWHELRQIPYGETISYGELAYRLGRPQAARAVGQAVGQNPWLIIVPCHRVIRRDGGLGGYRAGLQMKRQLLAHEKVKLRKNQ